MKNTLQPRVNGALTVAPPPFQRTYYPTNAERTDDKKFQCCLTPRTKPYLSYDQKIRTVRNNISTQCCPSTPIPLPTQSPELSLLSQRDWEVFGDVIPDEVVEFARNGVIYAGDDYTMTVLKYDGSWIYLSGTILGDKLHTITVDGDGVVYAGGIIFDGESTTPFVAVYDASSGTWANSVGGYIETITYGSVQALATGPNGVVYAAGADGTYPFVASYNKDTGIWTNMSDGVMVSQMGIVRSLTIDSIGTIYAGGNTYLNYIFVYAYNGEWVDINYGGELFSSATLLLAITVGPDQYVYAGGQYGPFPRYPYVMRLDTIAQVWTTIYDNSTELRNGTIESIVVSDGLVYACGNASFFSDSYVLQYDGSGWTSLTNSFPSSVYALCIDFSGALLAGGGGFIASYQPYTLIWSSSSEPNQTFNVYSQILPASPVRIFSGITVHYVNISNLISITPIQFYVTSVSVLGLESPPSNIVVYS